MASDNKAKEKIDIQLSPFDEFQGIYHSLWLVRPDKSFEIFKVGNSDYMKETNADAFKGIKDYEQGMQEYVDVFVLPEDADRVEKALCYDTLVEKVPETGFYVVPFRRMCEHGKLMYLQVRVARITAIDGSLNFILLLKEVDESIREGMKLQEDYQRVIKEKDVDELTGLRNRYGFERKIKTYSKCDHTLIGCIYIDVDGLRELNSAKGHIKGNELIKCVGMNILKYWGRDDTFRIAGDEFVVFCFDTEGDALFVTVEQFRERIIKAGYSVSIGWAIRDIKNLNIDELLKTAEEAMFEEKEQHYSGKRDRRKKK